MCILLLSRLFCSAGHCFDKLLISTYSEYLQLLTPTILKINYGCNNTVFSESKFFSNLLRDFHLDLLEAKSSKTFRIKYQLVEKFNKVNSVVLNRESSKSHTTVKSSVGCHLLYNGENCLEYYALLAE